MELLLFHLVTFGLVLLQAQSLAFLWRNRMLSLGHHGFACLGGYSVIIGLRAFGSGHHWTLQSPGDQVVGVLILAGTLVAAFSAAGALAWILGWLFGRLQEDYFAVATLVSAEVVRNTFANLGWVGGGMGYEIPYLILKNAGDGRIAYLLLYSSLALIVNLTLVLALLRLERSRLGILVDAVRDDSLAVESLGVHVRLVRTWVFCVGSALAGVSGALAIHFSTIIVPSDFTFQNALTVLLCVALGWRGPVRCVLTSLCVYTSFELIKARFLGLFGDSAGDLIFQWKEGLFALLMIAIAVLPALWQRWRPRVRAA